MSRRPSPPRTGPGSLALDGLSVTVDGARLLRQLTLDVPAGQTVGLVGPNGSGKSTALRCVNRALRPTAGSVLLDGTDLAELTPRQRARTVAAMSQEHVVDLDFSVEETVALGRSPHLPGNRAPGEEDRAICREAMARLGIEHLAHRGVLGLSGGERQRVMAARALAQRTPVLILDEPTNHLDIRHQIALLALLRDTRLTVLVVLHDLNLAAAVCDRIAVLHDGVLVACGPPVEVLTARTARTVFGVAATVVPHPLSGVPQLLYSLEPDDHTTPRSHPCADPVPPQQPSSSSRCS
ncbi:ABC transporter ATP-binding protein [Streptomyces spiramenti]|uniref:ABC transporter ATP-binding protein n=1 Tax=Streptomyces spiramenti TaxID=2720606 RepID=A0ABX1AQ43_9ACTN|nr:ABC transporter ATP-binding protein [Streptomyces spiramenti]NJP68281.1 ABC transporter ATP-binding protein [Streptomyces spiramenti]